METEETDGPPCQLPERIFAYREEPTSVRVTPYHKASRIRLILNALDADEVQMIQESPFGKLVEIADKPDFSGRFGRYIISRQLKVAKKHEAWFLFAGKPVRFSLREFALVSAKNFITEKPYWGELFGTLKEVPVSCVVRMLKKKTVADKDVRMKYAYLALLASVILPTTNTPRISQDHTELIKDLDAFFFSLSQNTIALEGFVLSLQLVMVEAVPALKEAVGDGSSSGSEGDSREKDDNIDGDKSGKHSISPGHARDIDVVGTADVQSIMLDRNSEISTSPDFEWSDDKDDVMVDNMVKLIEEGYAFKPSCFMEGASRVDVCRIREEARTELQNRKTVKTKVRSFTQVLDVLDPDSLASIVRDKLKGDIFLVQSNMSNLQESLVLFQNLVVQSCKDFQTRVNGLLKTDCTQCVPNNDETTIGANVGLTLDPALLFPNPSFSLGVTQEERLAAERDANLLVHRGQESGDEDKMLGEIDEVVIGCRKSKRQKLHTKPAVVDSHNASGNIDYSAKYSVVDVLSFHIGSFFRSLRRANQKSPHVFLDTQFVSQFTKIYTKFSKVSKKDSFKFTSNVIELIQNNPAHTDVESFYFPFNMDQKYWVGIIIDCSIWTVSVLNCNNARRTDYMMSKEVRPIAQMFPYLLKQVGKDVNQTREGKAMAIDRPRSIPQHNAVTDSSVVSVLFIQAHAVAGVDGCKCITPDVLDSEVERLVVTLYEATIGPL
ncbi:hypothetical protein N665_0027s0014 [Sinapis alba]|nr:hypothetical protein N665_0027s0014 [Sinapis alba]